MWINPETLQRVSPLNKNQIINLNPQQLQAATHTEGPLVIFAGAGSGKTRVVCARIAYLLQNNVHPKTIMALTFTNKAANEMRDRVLTSIGAPGKSCLISTFHSACAVLLRPYYTHLGFQNPYTIIDDQEQLSLLKTIMKELNISTYFLTAKNIQGAINKAKQDGIDATTFAGNASDSPKTLAISNVYNVYSQRLLQNCQMDFGDLLLGFVKLLESEENIRHHFQNRFQYIMVDEYQDTNCIQNRLINILAEQHQNICIVGDDDQSIYSWRGANPEYILSFKNTYPKAQSINLEQNYRSSKNIIEAASHVINKNQNRAPKKLWTDNEAGELIQLQHIEDNYQEASYIANQIHILNSQGVFLNNIAIFYRTNAQSRILEETFNRTDIAYRIYGSIKFFDRTEVRDLLAYLKLINNPHNAIAFDRILNKPARGIGKTTLKKITDLSNQLKISKFQVLSEKVEELPVSKAIKTKLQNFRELITSFMELCSNKNTSELLDLIIQKTDYYNFLETMDPETYADRFQNIQELLNSIRVLEEKNQINNLDAYLQHISLQSDLDSSSDTDKHSSFISLMTLHMAKGLEFDYVFVIGAEEGLLPHSNSTFDIRNLEEERRLFYVGMTRAKIKLFITACKRRMEHGSYNYHLPSPFLNEIPSEYIESNIPRSNYNFSPATKSSFSASTIDSTDNEEESVFRPGHLVFHKTFGKGIIKQTAPCSNGLKVTVIFKGLGIKTILSNYLSSEEF